MCGDSHMEYDVACLPDLDDFERMAHGDGTTGGDTTSYKGSKVQVSMHEKRSMAGSISLVGGTYPAVVDISWCASRTRKVSCACWEDLADHLVSQY